MQAPKCVQEHIKKLIPEAFINEIVAFIIFEIYPKCRKMPDVVICTDRNELIELKDRLILRSLKVSDTILSNGFFLHYKKGCDQPFYLLLSTNNVLSIIGSDEKDDLFLMKKFNDVTKVEIDDAGTSGKASVKVWIFDEVLPTILDDDYEIEDALKEKEDVDDVDDRILDHLRGKLSTARLNAATNLKIYEEKKLFRQKICHMVTEDARYDDDAPSMKGPRCFDKLSLGAVWQRVLNGKLIVGVPVQNTAKRVITDIELLLKCEHREALTYTTRFYTPDDSPPFWMQSSTNSIEEAPLTITATFDVPDFDDQSSITLNIAIRYKCEGKIYCIPLSTKIQAIDVVNNHMDPILKDDNTLGNEDILALISANIETKLNVHYIAPSVEKLQKFFVDKLKFSEKTFASHPVLVHAISPVNIVHGSLVFILEGSSGEEKMDQILLYTRTEGQLIMLVNLMYDLISSRCAIVPSNYTVTQKERNDLMESQDDITMSEELPEAVCEFGEALYREIEHVSEYLEKCMAAMSEKNVKKLSKPAANAGLSIDVMALGENAYRKLWSDLKQYMLARNELVKRILDK